MYNLKNILMTFFFVLSGSILSAAVFITIFFPTASLSVLMLWEVIASSVLTSLGNLFYISKKEISKKQMKLRKILHYIYINFIVVGIALLCGWVEDSKILQIIVLLILISAVYFTVSVLMFKQEEKTAEYINKQLRDRYPGEEE